MAGNIVALHVVRTFNTTASEIFRISIFREKREEKKRKNKSSKWDREPGREDILQLEESLMVLMTAGEKKPVSYGSQSK